ncbi:hypothetical protein SAMN04488054_103215 [Salibacterium qingdaonense]|uniref:Uncharacterized protein n=1 Tax=Salibacterium qingdaonense TaxID=266892 RepID=A0A1I4JKM6_9BACI|nr:hypothetical protein SAMN04488054_103215 [Salibacterium qingdaonense]
MACGVVQQPHRSGARMLRLLLRTAQVTRTPQDVRSGPASARAFPRCTQPRSVHNDVYQGTKPSKVPYELFMTTFKGVPNTIKCLRRCS